MRCISLRGERAQFVWLSSFMLAVRTHWNGERSYICPETVGADCSMCSWNRSRLTGFIATCRCVPGELLVREFCCLEVPSGLADDLLQYPADERRGLVAQVTRSNVRRPWAIESVRRVSVKSVVKDQEVIDAVGRLFGLPPVVGVSCGSFAEKFGPGVAHRMSAAVGGAAGA